MRDINENHHDAPPFVDALYTHSQYFKLCLFRFQSMGTLHTLTLKIEEIDKERNDIDRATCYEM